MTDDMTALPAERDALASALHLVLSDIPTVNHGGYAWCCPICHTNRIQHWVTGCPIMDDLKHRSPKTNGSDDPGCSWLAAKTLLDSIECQGQEGGVK